MVQEECRLCPAVRVALRDGVWRFNRFGELVNAGGEADEIRRMLERKEGER